MRRFESSRPSHIVARNTFLRRNELNRKVRTLEEELKVFSGNSNRELAEEICQYLNIELGGILISKFSDREIYCQVQENVRGRDVFIIQSTCSPVNDNLMELLIMIDAFKRASAKRITAVMPYYGYARQDRKDKPRVPITAKLVADLLSAANADRLLTMDLHAPQIQGFFNIPVDHLFAAPVIVDYIAKSNLPDLVLVSPDAGGVERTRAYAKRLNVPISIVDKRREKPNVAEVLHIIGDVEGKTAFIVDDMVDTAGTLTQTAQALKEGGAARVYACASHPVLSGSAIQRIEESVLEKVVMTNSIPFSERAKRNPKFIHLSIAPLFGEAIKRIHDNASVSSLFL